MKKTLLALPAILLLTSLLLCSRYETNNPLSSNYIGNYSFTVTTALLPDTLDLFTPYTIHYTTGTDTFSGVEVSSTSASLTDTALFDSTATESTFVLYFIKGTTDSVFVNAIRPNGNKLSAGIKRVIRNSYSISADTVVGLGGTIIGRCTKSFLPAIIPSRLTIEWRIDDAAFDTTLFIESCSTSVTAQTNTSTKILGATLLDGRGNRLPLRPVTIHIPGSAPALTAFTITNATTDTILLGSKLQTTLTKSDLDSTAFKAVVYLGAHSGWDTSAVKPYSTNQATTIQTVLDTGMLSVQIFLLDTTGLKSGILTKNIYIKHTLPTVSFSADTSYITYGDSTIFRVSSTTANHYAWQYDGLAYASTDSPYVKVFSGDSSTYHKLTCVGTDSFGYSGQPDSVLIKGRQFGYRLSGISFPAVLQAKRLTTFVVALDSVARAKRNKGVCTWAIPAGYDSLVYRGILRDTLKLRYPDSASFTIKTKFTDTTALSSNELTQNCFVHTYKPICTITVDSISVRAKSNYSLSVIASDTNTDGSIAAIEWDYKSTIISDTARTFTRTAGSVPDTYMVRARARDNDGFYSKWDSAIVAIYTSKPYFSPPGSDAIVYINETLTLHVYTHASAVGATVTKRLWDFNKDGTTDTVTMADSVSHLFTTKGKDTVLVRCVDSNNDTSDIADSIVVTVSGGEPVVTGLTKPAAVFINDSVIYTVTATDINGSIARYKVKWEGALSWDSSATGSFGKKFTSSGRKAVMALVIDNDGMVSDTVKDTVTIRLAKPTCLNISPDTAIFINDNYSCKIHAYDTNGTQYKPVRYYLSLNGGTNYTTQTDSAFTASFASSGLKTLKAYVKDDDSLTSDTLTDYITVRRCAPVLDSVVVPQGAQFISDSISVSIAARDTNGTIASRFASWNNGAFASVNNPFKVAANDTNPQILKVYVVDDDGYKSDTITKTIAIKLGLPSINRIATDTVSTNIFVRDPVRFKLKGSDTHNRLDSVFVSWQNNATFEKIVAVGDSAVFTHTFARSDSGSRTINFRVKNNDGVTKDSSITINVKAGAPVVSNLVIDTSANNLFVNDNRRYSLRATDANGLVKVVYAAWNGGTTANDSLIISRNTALIDTFLVHDYDTTGGNKTARFWCRDEDTVVAGYKDTSITIRKAAPLVWADKNGEGVKGDTLWVVAASGAGNYYVHSRSYDTNGVNNLPAKWYWNASPSLSGADSTVVDSFRYNFAAPLLNTGFPFYIYAKDDDGLLRGNITGNKFVVFADEIPPTPFPLNEILNTGGDSVTLRWQTYDAKDGINGTYFQILIDYASGATPSTVLQQDYGSLFNWDGIKYLFKFKPTSASFSWRVLARDARGSQATCATRYYVP